MIELNSGIEVLRFLMEEHGLTQKDLPETGSHGVVSKCWLVAGAECAPNPALAARFRLAHG